MNHLVTIRTLIAAARGVSSRLALNIAKHRPEAAVFLGDVTAIESAALAIVEAEKLLSEGRKPGESADVYLDRMELELERRFAAELASQPPGGAQTLGGHRQAGRQEDAVDITAGVPETTLGVTGNEDKPLVKLGPGGDFTTDYNPATPPKPNAYLPQGKLPIVGGILDTQA